MTPSPPPTPAGQRAAVERCKNEALAMQWDDDYGNRVVAIDALLMAFVAILDAADAAGGGS